jgi:hypothetical protein
VLAFWGKDPIEGESSIFQRHNIIAVQMRHWMAYKPREIPE